MKNKNLLLLIGILLVVGVISMFAFGGEKVSGTPLTMYKSPSCGCCVGNSAILANDGFDVKVVPTGDMEFVKSRFNIPREMQSCHTSVIGDYFVEGHVPQEAINKLLAEQPDIDGIALPGMPSGSPGMPGVKNQEWVIYSLKDGAYEEFMRIWKKKNIFTSLQAL